jgi:hypothetical protein
LKFHQRTENLLVDSDIDILFTSKFTFVIEILMGKSRLTPHCIQCSHFKVDDVGALEASSEPPVRIVEDSVTALATCAMTLIPAWMP